MTKKEARTFYLEKRLALTAEEGEVYEAGLQDNFSRIVFPPLRCVHVYHPMASKKEIDTAPYIQFLLRNVPDLTIVLPRITSTSEMEHVRRDSSTVLLVNSWGIHEPAAGEVIAPTDIDLVIVPLLVFDVSGYRVGYGKGFYDRFLAQCRRDVVKVGLGYFDPVARIADTNHFDVPLTIGITPTHLYEF